LIRGKMKYVNLVIDNRSNSTDTFYTYGCEDESVRKGQKVYVPFARGNKVREAYVFQVTDRPSEEIRGLKYVEHIDEEISLTEEMIDTCIWMKKRYLCRYIDAVKLFAPAGNVSKRGKKREPLKGLTGEKQDIEELTEEQQKVLKILNRSVLDADREIFLLHGVTSSGKTEIYMRVIAECVSCGKTAIMLVPEISLTKQIIDRFIGRFGADNIAVLHSRLSPGERFDEWKRIRDGRARIIIGARSAVFAPASDIGAVIMDEEHETTYKSDMTPKYDTVDVAVKRARLQKASVILGSATPSVVSYFRSENGIYRRLILKERYNRVPLPVVDTVDMREELKAGNRSVFSRQLYETMRETLASGQQVILFLNRRGYSTFISCRECGYVMKCPECGISLTYHKSRNRGICHYCGREQELPQLCPSCGSRYIKYFGTGTEKVEEETALLFPGHTFERLDMDTTRKKGSVSRILGAFEKGRTDILIGTQMVAKGLDFRNVGLVGIISADVTLNIPDFRSPERTFQLITQAAGRAGRGDKPGRVVIQTYTPENYAVKAAAEQDYERFYSTEIKMREYMGYPPYSDFIQITVDAKEKENAAEGAGYCAKLLAGMLGNEEKENLFPPQEIVSGSKKKNFRQYMLLKCPTGKRKKYMEMLETVKNSIIKDKSKKYDMAVDVNPYSLWRS